MSNFSSASSHVTDPDMLKLAKKRVKAKTGFMWHLASYVLVNVFLVLIYIFSSGWYFWPIWPILGWGLGLAFHFVSLLVSLSSNPSKDRVMEEYNRLKQAEDNDIVSYINTDDRRN